MYLFCFDLIYSIHNRHLYYIYSTSSHIIYCSIVFYSSFIIDFYYGYYYFITMGYNRFCAYISLECSFCIESGREKRCGIKDSSRVLQGNSCSFLLDKNEYIFDSFTFENYHNLLHNLYLLSIVLYYSILFYIVVYYTCV